MRARHAQELAAEKEKVHISCQAVIIHHCHLDQF